MVRYLIATLLTVGYTCSDPLIINETDTWTKHDQEVLDYTKNRCYDIYQLEAPCVKTFYKWGENNYGVICGPRDKK